MFKKVIILFFSVCIAMPAISQEEVKTDSLRKDALNVYMDASDYLKQQIPYINYVRDRKVADLVIISTSQRSGSGGREYSLFLEGQGEFSGMIDTLVFSSSPDDTYEQIRSKRVKVLRMGLIRYVQKTPLADYINIAFTEPISSEVSTDKWNNWVFRASLSGFLNGQSSYKYLHAYGGLSASRVTEDWKIDIDTDYSYGLDQFEIDEEIIESITKSRSADVLIVRSINDHWSYGGRAGVSSSTYSNYDLKFSVMPGIEFDVFPYSESTRRQLRILYSAGYVYNNYTDTTMYNKTEEALLSHSLSAAFEIVQKWGEIDLSVSWSNYLRNFSENSLSVYGSISWRVAKGLRINLGGNYSFIHNQISLVKGGASSEEILLRRKELKTNYRYFANFGFSYTFGSIYNNVVNPRFGGGGGGGMVIIH
ncbi:MAG: DUF481 domain-containing protein [Bacteroidales bacterium]|nr:DUF481 domain-containing protein [Bacteroidales bacterium]